MWELVTGFQGYAFCRAHSTAYAVEAYQGAYAKHYHPAEFMAGVLTNGKGFYSALVYTLESRRLGIGFLSPDVNAATDALTVEASNTPSGTPAPSLGKAIRVPLRCIKDIGDATLVRWRTECARAPFASVRDFCERVRPESTEAMNLIRAGAFDSLGKTRTEHFWRIGPQFVISLRLQRDAQSLNAHRAACLVEAHPCDANVRVVAMRNQPGKQIQIPIATARRCRIQHVFRLHRITRLWLHDDPEALQLERVIHDVRFHGSVFLCWRAFRTTFTSSKTISGIAPTARSMRHSEKGIREVFKNPARTAL